MNIKDYFEDIFADMYASKRRFDYHAAPHNTPRYSRNNYGLTAILAPQLLGAVVGAAVCRLFGFDGAVYLFFAILGALAVGTLKNNLYDQIALRHALIRNLLIDAALFVIGGAALLISQIIN